MKLLHMAAALLSAWVLTATAAGPETGVSGVNLNGKMFTLSSSAGGISLYPPQLYTTPYPTRRYPTTPYYTTTRPYIPESTVSQKYSPTTTRRYTTKPTSTRRYTTTHRYTTKPTSTRRYTTTHRYTTKPTTNPPTKTTTTQYHTTTLPPPTAPYARDVSVCLRYLTDARTTLFTLRQSRYPLRFTVDYADMMYYLDMDPYGGQTLIFRPNIKFWPGIKSEAWSRVCLTVDNMKYVAQVFSGLNTSIRKLLPRRWVSSGAPVMDFSEFNGQLTDVQMWDYTISKVDVINYMTRGAVSGPYSGSLLTWSYISYSTSGNTLLEDDEWQARQPISSSRGRKKRVKNRFNEVEHNRVQL
ncbi:uncharacterized protein [Pseudochaenichthys georgianus]|uniref:uncharacterized protein n=1 Tax=Pseudochaenichthys georgianus TaxID=52239 RepID=UPI00146E8F3D|nr:uncharacterized protein LOC117446380 [Pseudochaenichthys georgianus]